MMAIESGQDGGLRSATGGIRAAVLLVTGMSGAGRSTTLKILEDMGYEAFDNLPLPLVLALIESVAADAPAIAVGADARTRGFVIESMLGTLDEVACRTSRTLK